MDTPFRELSVHLWMSLSPCYIGDIQRGVNEMLNRQLMKYLDSVHGVVISYSDLEVLQHSGKILYDTPYIHFTVGARMVVFSPIIGSRLVGVVNKIGVDHIGLLVFGVFNASVTKEFMPKRAQYDDAENSWSIPDVITVGTAVQFCVTKVETVNDIMTIRGSLREKNTGVFVESEIPSSIPSKVPTAGITISEPPKVSAVSSTTATASTSSPSSSTTTASNNAAETKKSKSKGKITVPMGQKKSTVESEREPEAEADQLQEKPKKKKSKRLIEETDQTTPKVKKQKIKSS